MKRVYIAGPYSAKDLLTGLENIRAGMRMATKLLKHGIAVFCPWLDHQLFFQLREGEKLSLETIQAHSMAWLEASDAVFCLRGWQTSKGTQAEVFRAGELKIPVFYNYHEVLAWAEGKEKRIPMCVSCGGDTRIRNPTGTCDHLYYPENIRKVGV